MKTKRKKQTQSNVDDWEKSIFVVMQLLSLTVVNYTHKVSKCYLLRHQTVEEKSEHTYWWCINTPWRFEYFRNIGWKLVGPYVRRTRHARILIHRRTRNTLGHLLCNPKM